MALKPNFFPGLIYKELDRKNTTGIFGTLVNDTGTYAAPTVGPFVFFNEHDFFSPKLILDKCRDIEQKINEDATAYELFVRQKGRRPSYDIYAGFQPFNEAFKAFFPFIKILKKRLAPGDLILNLWDRTGWNAVLLAGLFPEQKVINIWEGDREALGYKGFQYWYNNENNCTNDNLQFIFADLNQPLPFADDSVGLVLGFDAFHRFDQSQLLSELFRIVKQDSAILFPHVHLSNAEPDPFFERGCRQLHGLDYDAFFKNSLANSGRKGYVFPEPEMFSFNELGEEQEKVIESQPDTHHYNAMIALLPAKWEEEEKLQTFRFDDYEHPEDCRVLVNPLVDVDLHQNRVWQNPDLRAGRVGYLLERHPIYLEKLVRDTSLSDQESIILYWAERLLTVAEIAKQTNVSLTELTNSLKRLYELDIIQLVPIKANHLRLQYFVSTQKYHLPQAEKTITTLWQRAIRLFGSNTFIWSELDDSELSYEECDELIQLIINAFHADDISAGDHIALLCANHFEAILASQAAMQSGIIVVPIDIHLAEPVQQHILSEIKPKKIFSDTQQYSWLHQQDYSVVYLDEEEEPPTGLLFSEWLEQAPEASAPRPDIESHQAACILYTSGSTGTPKGVVLSHTQLVNSGRLITETFHWKDNSRFFSPGELDSMSGFRNHLIAPLEVGAGIILAKASHKAHLFSLLECINTYQATILGTTPALLGQLLQFPKRSKPAVNKLNTIICTGSNLSPQLKIDFKNTFGKTPLNYYGLTETTGICIAESPDNFQLEQNTVGIARSCIAQIVDKSGKVVPLGTEGDLRIYGENCTKGYFQQQEKTASLIRQGWLYTGDRALRQDNGHIALLGRTRDIIKTASGQLVFAAEVENSIRELNHLVTAAAVTGISVQGDEKIVAFVVLKNDNSTDQQAIKKELKQHLIENIGPRKTPVFWYFIEQLPTNSSGKVMKQELIQTHQTPVNK